VSFGTELRRCGAAPRLGTVSRELRVVAGTFDSDHTEPLITVASERVPSVRRDHHHVTGFRNHFVIVDGEDMNRRTSGVSMRTWTL